MAIRIVWFLGLAFLFGLTIYSLNAILAPFIVATLLAYLSDPLVDKLEARGLGRTSGVLIVLFVMMLMLILLAGLVFPLLIKQLVHFIQQIPDYVGWLQSHLLPYLKSKLGIQLEGVEISRLRDLLSENWQKAGGLLQTLLAGATTSTVSFFMWLANAVLVPVVFFYLLRDWDVMIASIASLVPRPWLAVVTKLTLECNEVISAFLRGQLIVMMALGGVYSIGLTFIGLDLALFLGTMAGLASIVPYLGAFVGILSATIAAYIQFHEWLPLLYVAIVFGVGQTLEGMVLTPWLVGEKIGLHPVAVIFAIMAGGQLAGFTGVLIALPVAAVLMVFVRHLHDEYKQSEIYNASDHG
ncbi:MAG: AI-2E family transporter [Pseudomonadales bacterium]|nr:AI-2E family transporter [Pseudomonadales bacterium]